MSIQLSDASTFETLAHRRRRHRGDHDVRRLAVSGLRTPIDPLDAGPARLPCIRPVRKRVSLKRIRLSHQDTVAAVADARQGDEVAFERLVERHRGELYAHCYRMLGSVRSGDEQEGQAGARGAYRAPRPTPLCRGPAGADAVLARGQARQAAWWRRTQGSEAANFGRSSVWPHCSYTNCQYRSRSTRLRQPRPFSASASQAVVDIDPVGRDAERGQGVTLRGEILFVGGDARVADGEPAPRARAAGSTSATSRSARTPMAPSPRSPSSSARSAIADRGWRSVRLRLSVGT